VSRAMAAHDAESTTSCRSRAGAAHAALVSGARVMTSVIEARGFSPNPMTDRYQLGPPTAARDICARCTVRPTVITGRKKFFDSIRHALSRCDPRSRRLTMQTIWNDPSCGRETKVIWIIHTTTETTNTHQ